MMQEHANSTAGRQMKSLFDLTNERRGEKLAQGILRFVLQRDEGFRNDFCKWAGWEATVKTVDEEVGRGQHRHDLFFEFCNGLDKGVELKFGAVWTDAQKYNPGGIDLLIVPKWRLGEARELGFLSEQTKTWEKLVEEVVNKHEFARRVLDSLIEFAVGGYQLEVDDLLNEIRSWKSKTPSPERTAAFIRQCCEALGNGVVPGSMAPRLSQDYGHWGRYILREDRLECDHQLWTGFLFTFDSQGLIDKYALVMTTYSEPLAKQLGLCNIAAPWFTWPQGKGLEIAPEEGTYTVSKWNQECKEVLQRFAQLPPSSDQ